MQVEVMIFCGPGNYFQDVKYGQTISVEISVGSSGRMLLEKMNIPEEKVFSLLLNGVYTDLDVILSDGDRISIIPAMVGG